MTFQDNMPASPSKPETIEDYENRKHSPIIYSEHD